MPRVVEYVYLNVDCDVVGQLVVCHADGARLNVCQPL